jgi:hypothetical protein
MSPLTSRRRRSLRRSSCVATGAGAAAEPPPLAAQRAELHGTPLTDDHGLDSTSSPDRGHPRITAGGLLGCGWSASSQPCSGSSGGVSACEEGSTGGHPGASVGLDLLSNVRGDQASAAQQPVSGPVCVGCHCVCLVGVESKVGTGPSAGGADQPVVCLVQDAVASESVTFANRWHQRSVTRWIDESPQIACRRS